MVAVAQPWAVMAALLPLLGAQGPLVFQPSFIYMSGPIVNSVLIGSSAGVNFSLAVVNHMDAETVPDVIGSMVTYPVIIASVLCFIGYQPRSLKELLLIREGFDSKVGFAHSSFDSGALQRHRFLPLSDCSGNRRAGDWSLNVTPGMDASEVTVSVTRNLQLCLLNTTDCCTEPLCIIETLQVSACRDSKMLAYLLIQAEIYANSSFMGNVSENASVIPNQVFQPLGSCPCDLTAGACDIRCCCDEECSSDLKQLFSGSCFAGVFGGNVNPPFDQLCSVQAEHNVPDWFPFLCVQSSLDNTPFLGYFYHGSVSPSQAFSFKMPLQTVPQKLPNGYRQGDPIMTKENDYFTVPQQSMAGQCVENSPVAFLQNFDATCLTNLALYQEQSSFTQMINNGAGDMIQPNVVFENVTDVYSFITRIGDAQPTGSCKKETFAEYYTFTWKDRTVQEINVTVLTGELCDGELLTRRFTVNFVSENSTATTELSGNPGYQVGKPVRAVNMSSLDPATLNLWQPVGSSLCTPTFTPVLFGINSLSGCILEVDMNEDCNWLREKTIERLNSLVPATHVGKRGNSDYRVSNDWVKIIRLDPFNPKTNASVGNLEGVCQDIPANLNIHIITADVGAIEGIPQQEILGIQIGFSTVTWQFQCGIICENKPGYLPITVSVQFIKVPAQPPVPKTRFQINYTEYDCDRNDVCWPQLLYPLTRYYTGEPYSQSLAKGLVLVFFLLLAVILSNPWSKLLIIWDHTSL